MNKNTFIEKIREGKKPLGTFVDTASSYVTECIGYTGFDYVIIDNEHSPVEAETSAEIVRAAANLAAAGEEITEESLSGALYTGDLPDPDLIVRTAGEERLSNFLLWQAAYAEFYFTPTLWPDMTEESVNEALLEFARRTRRFGGVV